MLCWDFRVFLGINSVFFGAFLGVLLVFRGFFWCFVGFLGGSFGFCCVFEVAVAVFYGCLVFSVGFSIVLFSMKVFRFVKDFSWGLLAFLILGWKVAPLGRH